MKATLVPEVVTAYKASYAPIGKVILLLLSNLNPLDVVTLAFPTKIAPDSTWIIAV
jgi:hypothetical protein